MIKKNILNILCLSFLVVASLSAAAKNDCEKECADSSDVYFTNPPSDMEVDQCTGDVSPPAASYNSWLDYISDDPSCESSKNYPGSALPDPASISTEEPGSTTVYYEAPANACAKKATLSIEVVVNPCDEAVVKEGVVEVSCEKQSVDRGCPITVTAVAEVSDITYDCYEEECGEQDVPGSYKWIDGPSHTFTAEETNGTTTLTWTPKIEPGKDCKLGKIETCRVTINQVCTYTFEKGEVKAPDFCYNKAANHSATPGVLKKFYCGKEVGRTNVPAKFVKMEKQRDTYTVTYKWVPNCGAPCGDCPGEQQGAGSGAIIYDEDQCPPNTNWEDDPTGPDDETCQDPSAPSASRKASSAFKGSKSLAGSFIDNHNLTHRHTAVDYSAEGSQSSSCGSCSATAPSEGRLPSLQVQRIHRYDYSNRPSSFGQGVFWEYDMHVTWAIEREYQTPIPLSQYHPSTAGEEHVHTLDRRTTLLDPRTRFPWKMEDKYNQGSYTNPTHKAIKQMLLYDAENNRVSSAFDARYAVVSNYAGSKTYFELLPYITTPTQNNENKVASDTTQIHARLIRVEDRFENAITITYSDGRYIQTITDAHNRVLTVQYHVGSQNISHLICPNGEHIYYDYADEKLSNVRHPDGTETTITYGSDEEGQYIQYADAASEDTHRNKKVYFNAADEGSSRFVGSLNKILNGENEIAYQNWTMRVGDRTQVYYTEGGNTLIRYAYTTEDGKPVKTDYATNWVVGTNPLLQADLEWEVQTVFETNDLILADTQTDALGRTTTYTRDANGTLTGTAYPDGSTESVTYNQFNQPLVQIDRLGRRTVCTYDAQGNMLTKTHGEGTSDAGTWSWTYNARGQKTSATDANGNITHYEYDTNHFLIRVIEPADTVTAPRAEILITYDSAGRVATTTDPLGRITTFIYDERNRKQSVEYSDGSIESIEYGSGINANLAISSTDRNGNITTMEYDTQGRRIGQVVAANDPAIAVEDICSYLPGTARRLLCTKKGETVSYEYDYRNRVIATNVQPVIGQQLTTRYFFDGVQRRIGSADAYGRRQFTVYDINDYRVRSVAEMVPNALGMEVPTQADLAALTRQSVLNAPYLLTDKEYDAESQVIRSVDARGIATDYGYDAQGRRVRTIVAVGTPAEARSETAYDAQGNVIRSYAPRHFSESGDFITEYTYTGRNLRASITEALGRPEAATTLTTYHLDRRVETHIDARGNIWETLWHTCCGRFQGTVDPTGAGNISNTDYHGNVTHTAVVGNMAEQDTFHNPINTINETTTRFDARHRPIAQTKWLVDLDLINPNAVPIAGDLNFPVENGLTTTWEYDDNITDGMGIDAEYPIIISQLGLGAGSDGYATAVINPAGERSVSIRDGLGRIIASIDGEGNWNRVIHDTLVEENGSTLLQTTSITDPSTLALTNAVLSDGAGRRIISIDAENNRSVFGYDNNGNLVTSRDANNVGQDCIFDARNRDVSCTDTQGDKTTRTYDTANNIIHKTDGLGQTETSVFDARNRRVSTTDRINATTSYSYDSNNNLLTIVDAQGGQTTYGYDVRNLLVDEVFPEGQAGTTHKVYNYDGARRLTLRIVSTLEAPAQVEDTRYSYDRVNRLRSRIYPQEANAQDSFSYDQASRLTAASSQRYNNSANRSYDAASRLTAETMFIDGQTYTVGYAYDEANRQTSITYPDGKVINRGYTDRNQLSSITLAGETSSLITNSYDVGRREVSRQYGNGTTTSKTYRLDNLVSSITNSGIIDLSYSYDGNKRKTAETDGLNASASQTFAYDNEDRLTNWSGHGDSQDWNLSAVGDWTNTTRNGILENRDHTAVHEVTAIDGNPLDYDFKGNLTSHSNGQDYTWDSENRMKHAIISTDPTDRWSYRYDALGRRIAKTAPDGTQTVFVLAGAQVIQEYTNNIRENTYVYASYVDEPAVLINKNNEKYFYHTNHLYSVKSLTDESGNIAESYNYSAYGKTIIYDAAGNELLESAIAQPYGFTSRRLDNETGLYYFRARYYDVDLGRFITKDPLGYVDGYSFYHSYFIPNDTDPYGTSKNSSSGDFHWSYGPKTVTVMQSSIDLTKGLSIGGPLGKAAAVILAGTMTADLTVTGTFDIDMECTCTTKDPDDIYSLRNIADSDAHDMLYSNIDSMVLSAINQAAKGLSFVGNWTNPTDIYNSLKKMADDIGSNFWKTLSSGETTSGDEFTMARLGTRHAQGHFGSLIAEGERLTGGTCYISYFRLDRTGRGSFNRNPLDIRANLISYVTDTLLDQIEEPQKTAIKEAFKIWTAETEGN